MAFGPMSVGSDGSLMLVTDPTLRQENMSADAKAVGDALDKKLDKTGGTVSGDIAFPAIGDVAKSKKISFSGSTDGAEIYYQTTASDQGNLVLNLLDDANCFLRIALNGVFKSYFSPSDGNFHGNVNGTTDYATNAGKANNVQGYVIASQSSDPGAGSALASGKVLLVYE